MITLDATIVNVALGPIGHDLQASTSTLQWILNGYTLTLAALILLGGSLGDRYGRRRIFVAGKRSIHDRLAALRNCAQRGAPGGGQARAGGRRSASDPGQPGHGRIGFSPR
jgi:hypothetical protein